MTHIKMMVNKSKQKFGICFASLRSTGVILMLVMLSACTQMGLKPTGENNSVEESGESESQPASTESATSTEEGSPLKNTGLQPAQAIKDPMAGFKTPPELKTVYAKISALIKQKKNKAAISVADKVIAQKPNTAGLYYLRAKGLMLDGQYAEAVKSVEQVIKLQPNNYHAYNLKGVIERQQGNFEKARVSYQKAIDIYPGFASGYKNLAILADIYLRQLPLALSNYEQYQALVGDSDKKISGWIKDLQRRIKAQGVQQ